MKKIYTYILMGIALISLIFLLLMLSPWLYISNIKVKGLKTLDQANVIKQLSLDKPTNILSFNSFVAKKRLKENYYVEDVTVKKKLPNTVTITIKERDIVGYIPYSNSYLFIDKSGMVIDTKQSFTQNLPIIYGLSFDSFTIGKKLKTDNQDAFLVVMEITN